MSVEQRQSQKYRSYSQNGGCKLGTHYDAVGDGNGTSATELEPGLWGKQKRHPLRINQLSTMRLNAECPVAYNCLGKVDAQIPCQPPEPWLCEGVTICQQIFTGRVRRINR